MNWLTDAGLQPECLTQNCDFVGAESTVAQAESLLATEYAQFTASGAQPSITRVERHRSYSVPSHVRLHVDFVSPTTRFPSLATVHAVDLAAQSPDEANTPSTLRALYGIGDTEGTTGDGNRQAVASFLQEYYSPDDLQAFFAALYPIAKGRTPTLLGPNDPTNPGLEASLDIQYIMAIGGNILTDFWSTAGTQPGNPENEPFVAWLANISSQADSRIAKTISISYGDNEDTVQLDYAVRMNTEFMKLGARGVSILSSSGDGGVSGSQPTTCTRAFKVTGYLFECVRVYVMRRNSWTM